MIPASWNKAQYTVVTAAAATKVALFSPAEEIQFHVESPFSLLSVSPPSIYVFELLPGEVS
jgi:hypothetical protein